MNKLCVGLFLTLYLSFQYVHAASLDEAKAAADAGQYQKALGMYTTLAEEGDAKAQYNLGLMHLYGDGTKQNSTEALSWFKKSADAGFPEAQYRTGVMYFNGDGIAADYDTAMSYYRKAAEQGHAKSMLNMGLIYLKGEIVPQDDAEAAEWLKRSSEAGNGEAQFDLGHMYLYGQGIENDIVRSYMWIAISTENKQDNPDKIAKRDNMLRLLTFKMTPAQLEEAKTMIVKCHDLKLKSC